MPCVGWKEHTDSKTSIVVPPSDSQPIGDVGTNLFHHKNLRRKTNAVERSPGWAMRGSLKEPVYSQDLSSFHCEVAFDRRWRRLAETSQEREHFLLHHRAPESPAPIASVFLLSILPEDYCDFHFHLKIPFCLLSADARVLQQKTNM